MMALSLADLARRPSAVLLWNLAYVGCGAIGVVLNVSWFAQSLGRWRTLAGNSVAGIATSVRV
jgi:hypothetical protein